MSVLAFIYGETSSDVVTNYETEMHIASIYCVYSKVIWSCNANRNKHEGKTCAARNTVILAISYTVGFRQSITALFNWTFFRLDSSGPSSYRQSSRLYSFCALLRCGWCEGVLLYGTRKSVGSSALRSFFVSNACFTRDESSSKRVGGVGLSRKPSRLRSWRFALSREPPKLQQA